MKQLQTKFHVPRTQLRLLDRQKLCFICVDCDCVKAPKRIMGVSKKLGPENLTKMLLRETKYKFNSAFKN